MTSAFTASNLTALTARVADVAATAGGDLLSVTMGEMGDGSGRAFALVTVYACGAESEYRVTSPAPTGCPVWARGFDWQTEFRVDDETWMPVDSDDVVTLAAAIGA